MTSLRWLFFAASIIPCASRAFIAIGFSTSTSAPAVEAAIEARACIPLGVQTLTASGFTSLSIFL